MLGGGPLVGSAILLHPIVVARFVVVTAIAGRGSTLLALDVRVGSVAKTWGDYQHCAETKKVWGRGEP